MKTINRRFLNIFLVCTVLILYFGSMTAVSLTDPDEVFYSMTAQEMIEHKSFLTPLIFDQPQFEKPPLFYWGLLASFQLFGVHAFSARLVPVMCGLFGVLITFLFCRRVFSERIAYIATLMLAASVLYLGMSKAVLTDIMVSVLITAAFYAFYLWFREAKNIYLYGFAAAAALAVLTKGPVAIIILALACVLFLVVTKEFKRLKDFIVHPWVLLFLFLSVPWYAFIMAKYGRAFIDEFIIHDNWDRILFAEHKNFDKWYFYPMVMTIGLFPWSFYLIVMGRGWKKYAKDCLFLLIWIAVTFVVFQRAHSKLASYILPAMPALVLLLGISIDELSKRIKRLNVLAVIYGFLGFAIMAAPFILVRRFPDYIWSGALLAMVSLALALIISAFFLWKGEVLKAVVIKAVGLAMMMAVVGFGVPAKLEREVADQYLIKIVEDENYQGQPIISGKLYSRGVHFHTDNPVIVWDRDPQPFWSAHPIQVISDENKIIEFFNDRARVLCVIKPVYAEDLNRIFKNKRNNRVIFRDGKKVVIVSDRI